MAEKKTSLKLIGLVFICLIVGLAGLKTLEHVESSKPIVTALPITATLIIDFESAFVSYENGNKTIWRYENGCWQTYTEWNNHHTVWIFENISTRNPSVYGFLIEASMIGNFTIGSTYYEASRSVFVSSIAGVETGTNNKYWQYWVNGKYGEVGASKKRVYNNDVIEWRFTESEF
ncbi:MAG: DUF4430 domain-containing protein [Candidatus Thermoplasmatota archaeon]|nr:DUF4430 domain-containing protein [Candidatus Thermoplasmatota archaeon]MDI6887585.1 DUF4430 domain-containing protein [Candidatus Thermoplasmatota archaeon]